MKRKSDTELSEPPAKKSKEETPTEAKPLAPKIAHHSLTTDGLSWVDMFSLPSDLLPSKADLKALWDLHPEDKGKIKIMGKEIETPRWHQSYGKPYYFSGLHHEALPIPPLVQKYIDFANKTKYVEGFGGQEFNMCLINWYEDGSHYIGYHSDDETMMVQTKKGESVVFSISLGQKRDFSLQPRVKGQGKTLKLPMPHGSVVVMGGRCQKTHKHSVPKVGGQKGADLSFRINLTLRIFKDKK